MPLAHEWQNRLLDITYLIVFINAIHYKIRSEDRIIKKAT
ncbi:transposase [Clostridioides difficile]|nr:transposase [Clostridioides difficile]MCW0822774.1 transposase [Clostridioides difficile]MDL0336733.1 transposase [Clostridioides difficile]